MTSVVLLSCVLASLAGGVLLAYSICFGMFQLFRIHSVQVAEAREAQRALAASAPAETLA